MRLTRAEQAMWLVVGLAYFLVGSLVLLIGLAFKSILEP